MTKSKELTSPIELLTSIRDFNGIAVALARTVDGSSVVVARDPKTGDWSISPEGGIDLAAVARSPDLIPSE